MTNDLFSRLAAQEHSFKEQKFLSPVLRGQKVRVRIAGVVMSLSVVQPSGFQGWGVFQPLTYTTAQLVREPSLTERTKYLKMFPVMHLVACYRRKRQWFGLPAMQSDRRFGLQDVVPIALPDNIEIFDSVLTRFDGQQCWFEKHDPRRARMIAKTLREKLRNSIDSSEFRVAGSSAVERDAYEFALLRKLENEKDPDEIRIKKALTRGGAKFREYRELGNSFSVTYEVNGQVHRSTVDKASLSVQAAGICLDGFDANFDLQSLVGVIAEGQRTDQINFM